MTTLTSTFATVGVNLPAAYNESDVVFIDSSSWKIVFVDDFTDEEKNTIEKKLHAEDAEPKLSFGSAREAIDFLRTRMKRPHA
jgi:hypothetical protein